MSVEAIFRCPGPRLRAACLLALLTLATACGPRTEPFRTAPRPEADGFLAAVPAGHTVYDNRDLADVFTTLMFWTENGDYRSGIVRFDEPIRVAIRGPGSEAYRPFLAEFLAHIRAHAGLDIRTGGAPGDILVRFVPGAEYDEFVDAQCNVIFWQPDWPTYRANPVNWPEGWTGEPMKATAIIPDTHEPYKIRECIIEEVTQALGPVNDIYGLGPSIFNDDSGHVWPTRLDHLMLRVLYHPRMERGLAFKAARARAVEILDEINPEGRTPDVGRLPPLRQEDFADLRKRLFDVLDTGRDGDERLAVMREIERETARRFPNDAHDCAMNDFLAWMSERAGAEDAAERVEAAIALCTRVHGADDIRIAQLRFLKTELDFAAGRYRAVLDETERLIPIFGAYGQDEYVALSQISRAIAAYELDRPGWDGAPLGAAQAWSAYAFGDDNDLTDDLRRAGGG